MNYSGIISMLKEKYALMPLSVVENFKDEVYIEVRPQDFKNACISLHKLLHCPIMMLFGQDARKEKDSFRITSLFMAKECAKWFFISTDINKDNPSFESLSKDIYCASLFEREIKEMFGIEPIGSPDIRRLNLHDEVWPQGHYPLRKDFKPANVPDNGLPEYKFMHVEGEGIFEVPVGPVHAGIIGPGHFRFSCAGEPIINLELRLGFTHRGVEKLFEGKTIAEAIGIAERVSGDSSFAHSLAFCHAVEKIGNISTPERVLYLRGIFLELERIYNHANDIGGIAVDVGFTFPAALASIIKESILELNEKLTDSRYLKGVNTIGGALKDIDNKKESLLLDNLDRIIKDFNHLRKILKSSVSFMDRVDSTGVLRRKTAEDLGIVGLAARACGIPMDLRKDFPGVYSSIKFNIITEQKGDALARLNMRYAEFEESVLLIRQFLKRMNTTQTISSSDNTQKNGFGLGFAEGWRGMVLYWLKLDRDGKIDRCKVVDPSFHNWQALSFAVLGDIIPDFPLCNKSFDLSYSGNDL